MRILLTRIINVSNVIRFQHVNFVFISWTFPSRCHLCNWALWSSELSVTSGYL